MAAILGTTIIVGTGSAQTVTVDNAVLNLSTQVTGKKLGEASLFDQRAVTSLDQDVLKATANGEPSLGDVSIH
ncbi:hypothetical protein HC761_02455, partial [bacterium]|nr:hypothetical protein [bacterium]